MSKFLEAPIGPLPSEEDFQFTLQLSEGPPDSLSQGVGHWKQSYRLAHEAEDPRGMMVSIQNIYSGLNSAGRAGEALICARRLVSLGREVGDELVIGHALNNIAWAYWVMGDHVSAFKVATEAYAHATTLEGKPLIHPLTGPEEVRASATELLRSISQSRGQLRRSIADREAALQIYRKRRDLPRIVSSLEGLGLVFKDIGDYAAAVGYFTEALSVVETGSFPSVQAQFLTRAGLIGNLGVVLTYQGDTSSALAHIEETIKIYRALSDQFGLICALGQKGRALLRSARVSESIGTLQEMLRLAGGFNAESWCYAAHFNLARAHLAAGDRGRAAFHCEHACALAHEKLGHVDVENYWLRAVLYHPLATIGTTGGDLDRFIALAYHAVDALREAVRGSFPAVVIGRWIDAFEILLEAAFQESPSKRLSLSLPDANDAGSLDGQGAFNEIEQSAQASPFLGWQALDIGLYCAESLRAQEFQERMLLDKAELQELHDPGAIEELSRIEAELAQLQSSPPIVIAGTASFGEDGRLVEGERESDESIARQVRKQESHVRRRKELTAIRDTVAQSTIESFSTPTLPLPEPARLADVREVLGEDELFLEFVLLGQADAISRPRSDVVSWPAASQPKSAYVIAISKSWMDVVPIGPTAEIQQRCEKLLHMLDRFGASVSLPFFQSEAAGIYDLLFRPVLKRAGDFLHSVRHLVIAPDGVLHEVPLDVLVEENEEVSSWSELAFLVRRFTMEYTSSATLFVDSRRGRYRRGEPGGWFVGLGDPTYDPSWQPSPFDPLPGTRQELDAITAVVRCRAADESVHLLLATEASKEQLLNAELLRQAEYLHLACHGSAGKLPFPDGALYLAQQAGGTAPQCVLTAREVMDLHTHAKLVVLSACESGLGIRSRGEGIQGMTRAWLFAGAQAIATTHWRVDDEATAELMTNFYRALLVENDSAADALAAAKRTALASDRFSCPVFWGAFVLTGGRSSPAPLPGQEPDILSSAAPRQSPTRPSLSLSHHETQLLSACAHAWEWTWGNARSIGPVFCIAATNLGRALMATGQVSGVSTSSPIGLVPRNCRIAWEYWARQQQIDLAIQAYQAYSMWVPSARTEEDDAVASAYRNENLTAVRRLFYEERLKKTFELVVDASLDVTLHTKVAWTQAKSATSERNLPVEVVIPVNESVRCDESHFRYCRNLGRAVIRIGPGETVQLSERMLDYVVTMEEDAFAMGGTWGSPVVPHDLTIRLHPDFIPLRLQRETLGKGVSAAALRFTTGGAVVTLRTTTRPWLERVALLFRRVPGAVDKFAATGSPFLAETEFGVFERLIQQVQGKSNG